MRAWLALVVASGCQEPPPAVSLPPPPARTEKADTRFMKIRELLSEKPESERRAVELYPLVQPICQDEKERKEFIETAKWSSSFSTGEIYLTKTLAGDVIEHVATTCFRSDPEATLALLDQAKAAIPDVVRFDLIRARLFATANQFEPALASVKTAKEAGSIHAIALMANIQAQLARTQSVGYRTGMLDEAIATVSAEPDGSWPLVDLAAVLSTRARLLTERAAWEDGDRAKKTLLLANASWQRLSHPPFIENIRTRAQDVHCFNTVEIGIDRQAERAASGASGDGSEGFARPARMAGPPGDRTSHGGGAGPIGLAPCKGAAELSRHLGAATAAGVKIGEGFDEPRFLQIEKLSHRIETLPPKTVVVIVARGDELELIEWARPAGRFLTQIAAKKPRVIAVDRTQSDRAQALFQRILTLGGVEPEETIDSDSTFAMPCLSAILAQRKTPKTCPFDAARIARLEKMTNFGFSVLIGRDLDAEIDDLYLYQLDAVLLSFRQSRMEKGIDAWLKSVSDVLIVHP